MNALSLPTESQILYFYNQILSLINMDVALKKLTR